MDDEDNDNDQAKRTKSPTRDAAVPSPPSIPARLPDALIVRLADLVERFQEHLAQAHLTSDAAAALHEEALALQAEICDWYCT